MLQQPKSLLTNGAVCSETAVVTTDPMLLSSKCQCVGQQPVRVNTSHRHSCRLGSFSEGFFSFPAMHLNDLEWFTENSRKGGNIPNWVIAEMTDRQSGRRGPWSSKDLYLHPSSLAKSLGCIFALSVDSKFFKTGTISASILLQVMWHTSYLHFWTSVSNK